MSLVRIQDALKTASVSSYPILIDMLLLVLIDIQNKQSITYKNLPAKQYNDEIESYLLLHALSVAIKNYPAARHYLSLLWMNTGTQITSLYLTRPHLFLSQSAIFLTKEILDQYYHYLSSIENAWILRWSQVILKVENRYKLDHNLEFTNYVEVIAEKPPLFINSFLEKEEALLNKINHVDLTAFELQKMIPTLFGLLENAHAHNLYHEPVHPNVARVKKSLIELFENIKNNNKKKETEIATIISPNILPQLTSLSLPLTQAVPVFLQDIKGMESLLLCYPFVWDILIAIDDTVSLNYIFTLWQTTGHSYFKASTMLKNIINYYEHSGFHPSMLVFFKNLLHAIHAEPELYKVGGSNPYSAILETMFNYVNNKSPLLLHPLIQNALLFEITRYFFESGQYEKSLILINEYQLVKYESKDQNFMARFCIMSFSHDACIKPALEKAKSLLKIKADNFPLRQRLVESIQNLVLDPPEDSLLALLEFLHDIKSCFKETHVENLLKCIFEKKLGDCLFQQWAQRSNESKGGLTSFSIHTPFLKIIQLRLLQEESTKPKMEAYLYKVPSNLSQKKIYELLTAEQRAISN